MPPPSPGSPTTGGASAASIPERPRLAWNVRAFEYELGLVIRQPSYCMVVDSEAKPFVAELVSLLDGRTVPELCAKMGNFIGVLQVLGQFAEQGMLIDHAERSRPAPELASVELPSLHGAKVLASGDEALAEAMASRLAGLGARVRLGTIEDVRDEVLIVCRAAPDIEAFERINTRARAAAIRWLPVFALADECITGPFVDVPSSACFACFLLRWLGICRTVQHERNFLAHLRRGGWRDESPLAGSDWLVQASLPSVAGWLSGQRPANFVAITALSDGTTREHSLVRHALCKDCDWVRVAAEESLTPAAWADRPIPLGELAPKLEPLVDERFGLGSVEPTPESKRPSRAGLPYIVLTRFAFPRPDEVIGKQTNYTHGSASTPEHARTLAIVEALERYAGLSPPPTGVVAPYEAVSEHALLPTELPLFSRAQYAEEGFAFAPFDPKKPLHWLWGYSLTEKRRRLVPAHAVHYGDDDTLVTETSSGVAAHSARSQALLNGVCEVIERDAFMIHWLNKLSPPLVELEKSEDADVRRFVGYVRSKGWDPRVAELTTELGVPVFLALGVRDDGLGHALLVGGGSSPDPGTGLVRALRELYSAAVGQPEIWSPPELLLPKDVKRSNQHTDFYAHRENLVRAEFLWASPRRVPPPAPAAPDTVRLEALVEHLARYGLEVIGAVLDAPDVAGRGLHVVRALVPGLQPFAFGRAYLRLGGRRLYEAPVRMGHRSEPLSQHELNSDPHIFP